MRKLRVGRTKLLLFLFWTMALLLVFGSTAAQYTMTLLGALLATVVAVLTYRWQPRSSQWVSRISLHTPYLTLSAALIASASDVVGFASQGPPWRYAVIMPIMCLVAALDGNNRRRVVQCRGTHSNNIVRGVRSSSLLSNNIILIVAFAILCISYLGVGIYFDNFNADNFIVPVPPFILLSYGLGFFLGSDWRFAHTATGEMLDRIPIFQHRAARLFSIVALAYSVIALADASWAPFSSPPPFANHETLFVLIAAAVIAPRYRTATLLVGSVAVAVSTMKYPTATLLLIVISGVLIVAISRLFTGRSVYVALLASVPAVGLFYSAYGEKIVQQFYQQSSRTNNSNTRERLWSQGFDVIAENPIVGGHGQVSITARALIDGRLANVPFHNSLITLGVFGGLLCIILFVALVVAGAVVCVRRLANSNGSAVCPLIALTGMFLTLLFNPVLDSLGNSVCTYAILIWVLSQNAADLDSGVGSSENESASDYASPRRALNVGGWK